MMKNGRIALIAYALVFSLGLAASETAPFLDNYLAKSFPENTEVRKQYWTSLITVPKEGAWAFKEKVVPSKFGQVKLGATRRENDFIIQFQNGSNGDFLPWSQGSFSIQRNSTTGYFMQAKIFLQDDPTCYARLYPEAEATRMDIVMYGAVVKKGLYVPGLIYYVLSGSFAGIVNQTKSSFDWSKVFGTGSASSQADFAERLRAAYGPPTASAALGQLPSVSSGAPPQAQSQPGHGPEAQPSGIQAPAPVIARAALPLVPQPAPPAALLPRPQAIAALAAKAGGIEALGASLSARGEAWVELAAPAADAPPAALGFTDDSDPLVPRGSVVPRPSYASLAKYETGKGLPPSQLRAAVYLDSLQNPGAVYALSGESLKALALPYFDAAGHCRVAFFSDSRELDWAELARVKDARIRILRIAAQ